MTDDIEHRNAERDTLRAALTLCVTALRRAVVTQPYGDCPGCGRRNGQHNADCLVNRALTHPAVRKAGL